MEKHGFEFGFEFGFHDSRAHICYYTELPYHTCPRSWAYSNPPQIHTDTQLKWRKSWGSDSKAHISYSWDRLTHECASSSLVQSTTLVTRPDFHKSSPFIRKTIFKSKWTTSIQKWVGFPIRTANTGAKVLIKEINGIRTYPPNPSSTIIKGNRGDKGNLVESGGSVWMS